jgi:hypothetical protein
MAFYSSYQGHAQQQQYVPEYVPREYKVDYRMGYHMVPRQAHGQPLDYLPPRMGLSKAAKVFSPQRPGRTHNMYSNSSIQKQPFEQKHQEHNFHITDVEQKSCVSPESPTSTDFYDTAFLTPGGQRICFNFTAVNIPVLPVAPLISAA